MRKVFISRKALGRIDDLERYLINEIKLSEYATRKYSSRMRAFVHNLALPVDYALCRFKEWRKMGWRCAIFEKEWVIAYEIFDKQILVHDIRHTTTMKE